LVRSHSIFDGIMFLDYEPWIFLLMHLFTVAFCVGGVVEAGNPYNKMSKMFSSQGEVKIREPG